MKKIILWGIIFAYTVFILIFVHEMDISTTDEVSLKFEAVEQRIEGNKTIKPCKGEEHVIVADAGAIEFSFEDAQMLMRIAMAEAGGEGIEGKAWVMAVVLNRVADPRFPESVEGVIFQEHQFSPIADGRYYEVEPDVECHIALAQIEQGMLADVDALYFENAETSWQQDNCDYVDTIGHHRFYKN